MSKKYEIYLGLNDKDTKKQIITTSNAVEKLSKILLGTGLECFSYNLIRGVYKHSDGTIVNENTIQLILIEDEDINSYIKLLCELLKREFNQKSILVTQTHILK
jgi:hypothetical protein